MVLAPGEREPVGCCGLTDVSGSGPGILTLIPAHGWKCDPETWQRHRGTRLPGQVPVGPVLWAGLLFPLLTQEVSNVSFSMTWLNGKTSKGDREGEAAVRDSCPSMWLSYVVMKPVPQLQVARPKSHLFPAQQGWLGDSR